VRFLQLAGEPVTRQPLEEFTEVSSIILDTQLSRDARIAALDRLVHCPKRRAFPIFIQILGCSDPTLRNAALEKLPALRDSRALFVLVNLFNSLREDEDRLNVARSIARQGDPRANAWLSEQQGLSLPTEPVHPYPYTFCGTDPVPPYEMTSPRTRITSAASLRDKALREDLGRESGYAIYVVPARKPLELYLARRRSEHVTASRGEDVYAAGEIEVQGIVVRYLDNHSGGFAPDPSSFEIVSNCLAAAGIEHDTSGFSLSWPSDYFSEEFLSRYPTPGENQK